ncbi:Bcr/CflA family drug resistance efflux transporter [Salinibacterium xinjiangense]|uniref:MFS transporter, DHA1 family, bicyclomycin/chloramphenicol resistance protein n=1 Tax=Salinibacterium xinjiangense TaxID=386302 RepID=A0A2C8ZAM5_9MICO|nr:multidrug effflux MFS transporter [Salinibacterium xinjiangense]GGK90430.1 Bcr/CflA family drug resistance efflux transporter [Salinibacterium xinjiangense]SOE61155.1 MFS transporter, DHA1 family, bicyclomycin/chloramphenicol resistance protein [Salinibacterium xinjiangense]
MTTVVHPGDSLLPRERLVYVLVLGALTALGPFTIDLYLPAFPTIEADLDVSTAAIQLTLTATTLGFALGQLVVGPWSDKIGRRMPLIIATSVHVFASLGVAIAPSIELLMVFRVLQGAGAAAGGVVALAVVRDLFGGLPLVRMLSRLALVNGLAPILAPLIGSQLLLIFPWRGIFIFLAAYGVLVVLAAVFFIVETLPPARRMDLGHSTMRQRYRSLLGDRVFIGVAIIGGMTFSGLFTYLSSSSFLFQGVYGLDPQQFGLLFAVNSLGIVSGVQASAFLMRFIGPQWILVGAGVALLVTSATIVVLDMQAVGLFGILIPLFFFIMACGFSFPATQVLALNGHGSEAGTAASLLGALNFGLAGIISPIVGLFGIVNAIPMGVIMGLTAMVSIIVMWTVVRPRSVPALSR